MDRLEPQSFVELLAGSLVAVAFILAVVSLWEKPRAHATRLLSLFSVVALSLFANNPWTYFAAVFIIATAVTELEFLQNLAAIVRGDKHWFDYRKSVQGHVQPEQIPATPARTAMEYKVLNTLWTKQVNKWPDRSQWFAFSISPTAPDYARFREAAYKLMGEGFVREAENGMFCLTPNGFDYCKANYAVFPADQWWPEEPLLAENLSRLLAGNSAGVNPRVISPAS
jgi:hypothetical protein